jgi:NADPH-dependent 2,4-dienoyl-CoA reductase/sulfur reductase-like enzyme
MSRDIVIVGGSVAGVRTARTLRAQGHDGAITIVEAETESPYDKPPLSKAAIGAEPRVPLLSAAEAHDLDIELLLGRRVAELHTDASHIRFQDDTVMGFDALVIATGARARRVSWEQPGVHVLRTLADARAVRADLASAKHLLVVGAGFIGAEVASLARAHGVDVTMVDPAPVPMARVVGPALGERFGDLHRRHGVDTRFGVSVLDVRRDGGHLHARLSDGFRLRTDSVVVGIGAEPDTAWLDTSGVHIDNGVVCDEYGRTSGFPHIFAIGDVARWRHPRLGEGVRVEHWTNAVEQADRVAHTIMNPTTPVAHDPVPYVWSDQYDWKIQFMGTRDPNGTPEVFEQTDTPGPFRLAALWSDDRGRLTGGATVNWPRVSVRLRKAIALGTPTARLREQLVEAGVPA